MFKNIFISFVIACIAFSSIFTAIPTFAEDNNVIGFTQCNFTTSSKSNSITPCIQQIMTFLFVIGIFSMAFRIAYIGINKFNPLGQNADAQQVGLIRDTIIGLILLGAPAIILGALNQDLLKLDFLNFNSFTGGTPAIKANKSTSEVNKTQATKIVSGSTGTGYIEDPNALAFASSTVSGGRLTSITLATGGTKYLVPPAVNITGGGGTGAKAVATVRDGIVTGVKITNPGSGYTIGPEISFNDAGDFTTAQNQPATTVAGISSLLLDSSFQAFVAGNRTESSTIIKVLQVAKNCDYPVFTFSGASSNDCENVKSDEFQGVFNKYADDVSFIKTAAARKISSYEGPFKNTVPIKIRWVNRQPDVSDGYNYGTFDEPAGKITCFTNYFTVSADGYPDKQISTKECGKNNLDMDRAKLTEFGTFNRGCFIFGCSSYELRYPTPGAIAGLDFPSGFSFNRQITILD
ncbi:MAG: hypothetical protein H7196_01345 [candidate division SR1 bacterium]|nr:hypothetical protein [candidate division SR1 bacterium]